MILKYMIFKKFFCTCFLFRGDHVQWQGEAHSSLLNLLFGAMSSSEDVAARFPAPIGMALEFVKYKRTHNKLENQSKRELS